MTYKTPGKVIHILLDAVSKNGNLLIKTLRNTSHTITSAMLLGCNEKLEWKQTADGLKVNRPVSLPTLHSVCFRITFADGI